MALGSIAIFLAFEAIEWLCCWPAHWPAFVVAGICGLYTWCVLSLEEALARERLWQQATDTRTLRENPSEFHRVFRADSSRSIDAENDHHTCRWVSHLARFLDLALFDILEASGDFLLSTFHYLRLHKLLDILRSWL